MGLWHYFVDLLRGVSQLKKSSVQHVDPAPDQPPSVPGTASHLSVLQQGATFWNTWRQQQPTIQPDLRGADLHKANLSGYNFAGTNLQGADLSHAVLCGTNLQGAHLEGTNLSHARFVSTASDEEFPPANLQHVFFDQASNLEGVIFGDAARRATLLADVHWNGCNLTVLDWKLLHITGEDAQAQRYKTRLRNRGAARASHQLAVALADQGLHDEAATYAYRARVLEREALILLALGRPARVFGQLWILRLVQIRGSKTRLWRVLGVLLPFLSFVLSFLIYLGSQTSAIASLFIPLLAIPLGVLLLLTVLAVLPPLPKLVLLLGFLTILFPLLFIIFLGFVLSAIASPTLGRLPAGSVSAAPLVAALWITLVIYLVYALLTRLPHRFKRLQTRLELWWRGYRSLYPLLRLTLVDYGRIVFSSFLDALAGYGYRPAKSLRGYVMVIILFALLYWIFGYLDGIQAATVMAQHLHRAVIAVPVLTPLEALVYSLTSFHGRGFFPGTGIRLDDPLVIFAAIEAMVGLVIEVSFIATFTQRFLSR